MNISINEKTRRLVWQKSFWLDQNGNLTVIIPNGILDSWLCVLTFQ